MHMAELDAGQGDCLVLGVAGGTLFYVLICRCPGCSAQWRPPPRGDQRRAGRPDADLRLVFIAILGMMLGSAFTPEVLRAWRLAGFVRLARLYVILATLSSGFLSPDGALRTADGLFLGSARRLDEMILAGGALGGDERRISLAMARAS